VRKVFALSAVHYAHLSLPPRRDREGVYFGNWGFNTIGESGFVVPGAYLNQSKQKFEESHLLTINVNKTTYRIRPFYWVFAKDILSRR